MAGGSTGSRSGTFLPMGGLGRRYWTSSPPWVWEGWSRLGKARGVGRRNGGSGSSGSRRRSGGWRPRSWVPGGNNRCSYPPPPMASTQTRDHLIEECAEWREQQRTLWREVRRKTGRWKSRGKVLDVLTDERCSKAVQAFLSTTDVGRRIPAPAEEDARSEASEWELGSSGSEKRRGKQSLRSWALRSRNPCFSPHPPSWHPQKRSRKRGPLSFDLSFVISLVRSLSSGKGQGGEQRKACKVPPSRGQRRGNGQKVRRDRLHTSMTKQKQKIPPGVRRRGAGSDGVFFRSFFLLNISVLFLCNFLCAHLFSLGTGLGGGQRGLATCRFCADSGRETRKK